MSTCRRCQADLEADAAFCGSCGAPTIERDTPDAQDFYQVDRSAPPAYAPSAMVPPPRRRFPWLGVVTVLAIVSAAVLGALVVRERSGVAAPEATPASTGPVAVASASPTAATQPTATVTASPPVVAPPVATPPVVTPPVVTPSLPTPASKVSVAIPAAARTCGTYSDDAYSVAYAGNSVTTCPFAGNVLQAYRAAAPGGGAVVVRVHSPVTDRWYDMTCEDTSPVRCTGGRGAVVFIGPYQGE